MDVHLQVPDSEADKVRSGVYSFISRVAEEAGEKPFFCITIIPVGVEFLYDLKFASSATAAAFVDFLPTLFNGQMATSIRSTHHDLDLGYALRDDAVEQLGEEPGRNTISKASSGDLRDCDGGSVWWRLGEQSGAIA
jgi:hypothetical protein